MYKTAQLVLENIVSGKLDKKAGAEILTALKADESKGYEEMAIIGMSVRLPKAESICEFWDNLANGIDCITEFPDARRTECDKLFHIAYPDRNVFEYVSGGYLNEINKFDDNFFKLSHSEASLMDPNQRLFLEVVWEALEDAGYGGRKLSGSKTGVFLGYNGWSLYGQMVSLVDPSLTAASRAGNISSIIASRIAYILDLKGPSILVDTACSSALVALHLACQAIRNGECSVAIAGGVKINIFPVRENDSLGIEAADSKTKAFDDSASGTVWGEGSVALLIKLLSKAIEDGDNIHAIIKGSAVNQDGNSSGITAPNVKAQEEVIIKAWENAGVDPETITYIEAHGTGTKLGDPIEIDGIKRAFAHYTAKKQFCGIGSLKTNIGHLDSTSGLASIIKAVLAIKNGKIPPTLNFFKPNSKIYFEDLPVYVNDTIRKWESIDTPRRCGVSAFGLSGTNCHVILEEFNETRNKSLDMDDGMDIFTLSAKSEDALLELVKRYAKHLMDNRQLALRDICFTANEGRGHYEYRLAFPVSDRMELESKLELLAGSGIPLSGIDGVFYRKSKVVSKDKPIRAAGELIEEDKRDLTDLAHLELQNMKSSLKKKDRASVEKLCKLYIKGADIKWDDFYFQNKGMRVSLPTYPFDRRKCWIDLKNRVGKENTDMNIGHPLMNGQHIQSIDEDIFISNFSPDKHWVLSDHRILGNCTIPGTTYLEMARQAVNHYYKDCCTELSDVLFISPLVVNDGETRDVHTIIKRDGSGMKFTIASKYVDNTGEESWSKHAEGRIEGIEIEKPEKCLIKDIIKKLKRIDIDEIDISSPGPIKFGPRWTEIRLKELFYGENEYLMKLEFPGRFINDFNKYVFHPSLMDAAITSAGPFGGKELHLPLSYKKLRIYRAAGQVIYSHIRKNGDWPENGETKTFDVTIMDESGDIIIDVDKFTSKKVHKSESMFKELSHERNFYHRLSWVEKALDVQEWRATDGCVLILKDEKGLWKGIAELLEARGVEIIYVDIGNEYRQTSNDSFTLIGTGEGYDKFFTIIKSRQISYIVYMFSLYDRVMTLKDFEESQKRGAENLFHLTKSMVKNKVKGLIKILLISMNTEEVTGSESSLNPWNASLSGLGKVIGMEYPQLVCKSVDIDEHISMEDIVNELLAKEDYYKAAYRFGKRYVEEFGELKVGDIKESKISLKRDGIYLITGGIGAIGLELSKYLASLEKINLCLINRSKVPEKGKWENILAKDDTCKMSKRIRGILEIEELGAEVICCVADVSKYEEMTRLLTVLRERFGRINGVIHCAGVAGDGFIIRKEYDTLMDVLSPKTYGTWLLDRLTRTDSPDFFVMCSSLTAVFGGAGQSDYAAGNSFMDAYAAYRNRNGLRTLSINWPAWKESGMAMERGTNIDGRFKALPTAKAIEIFDKVFNSDLKRVLIGEVNYKEIAPMIDKSPVKISNEIRVKIEEYSSQRSDTAKNAKNKTAAEVVIKGKFKKDYTETEIRLSYIWADILDIGELDIYESFNDMGGDSILAVSLLKSINIHFPDMVDIADIFTYPSVNRMSEYIDSKKRKSADMKGKKDNTASGMGDILLLLENGEISVEVAEKMMKQEAVEIGDN